MNIRLIALLLAGASVFTSVRGDEPEPGAAARYEQADSDRDGRLSREEFISSVRNKKNWWSLGAERANTGLNSATPEMFDALDRDRDGFLTSAELGLGQRLRETRGDNSFGASGTRSERPAPASIPTNPHSEDPR